MSRTDNIEGQNIDYFHDDNILNVISDINVKEEKIVFFDADSLIYHCLYSGKDEFGEKNPEYVDLDLEMLKGKLSESVLKVFNNIEKYFTVPKYYIFIKGKGNKRYDILPSYKANRPPSNPLSIPLYQHLKDTFGAIESNGYESDDYVYSASLAINHEGIITSVDGDMLQCPGIHYNYQKNIWLRQTEAASRLHTAIKVLTGDTGDNVLVNKGLGPKKAAKIVHEGMTDYQYIRAIYQTYIKYNSENAKKLLKDTYNLLRLHNVKETYE